MPPALPSGAQGGDDANYLLPNGQVFHVGSTAKHGLSTRRAPTATSAGTLVNGPNLPVVGTNQLHGRGITGGNAGQWEYSFGPGAEWAAGAAGGSPSYFYEYNYLSNTFTQGERSPAAAVLIIAAPL